MLHDELRHDGLRYGAHIVSVLAFYVLTNTGFDSMCFTQSGMSKLLTAVTHRKHSIEWGGDVYSSAVDMNT